jgi:dienelactone hydrolase
MYTTRYAIIGLALLTFGATSCSGSGSGPSDAIPTQAPTTTPATTAPATTVRATTATSDPNVPGATRGTTPALVAPGVSLLDVPDGSYAVGVADLPLPNAIAYYPAKANTGTGDHPYLDPKLLAGSGLPVEVFSTLTTTSRIRATPLATSSPRPVVVLAPGFGSMIALSTSLAEHLASHGYVVVAVQTDLAAESASLMPNDAHGAARTAQIAASLDLIGSPGFAELVGPVDNSRIAVGGHSYAGSIAFNVSLHDPRVAAVFDLDGRLFGDAAAKPTEVPTLVVTSTGSGEADDRQLQEIVRTGKKSIAVGLLGSQHFDLTDAAAIGGLLRSAGIPFELGTIGAVATSNTSAIVQRFLDAALDEKPHVPTAATLLDGLPSTTDHAFASGS